MKDDDNYFQVSGNLIILFLLFLLYVVGVFASGGDPTILVAATAVILVVGTALILTRKKPAGTAEPSERPVHSCPRCWRSHDKHDSSCDYCGLTLNRDDNPFRDQRDQTPPRGETPPPDQTPPRDQTQAKALPRPGPWEKAPARKSRIPCSPYRPEARRKDR